MTAGCVARILVVIQAWLARRNAIVYSIYLLYWRVLNYIWSFLFVRVTCAQDQCIKHTKNKNKNRMSFWTCVLHVNQVSKKKFQTKKWNWNWNLFYFLLVELTTFFEQRQKLFFDCHFEFELFFCIKLLASVLTNFFMCFLERWKSDWNQVLSLDKTVFGVNVNVIYGIDMLVT